MARERAPGSEAEQIAHVCTKRALVFSVRDYSREPGRDEKIAAHLCPLRASRARVDCSQAERDKRDDSGSEKVSVHYSPPFVSARGLNMESEAIPTRPSGSFTR